MRSALLVVLAACGDNVDLGICYELIGNFDTTESSTPEVIRWQVCAGAEPLTSTRLLRGTLIARSPDGERGLAVLADGTTALFGLRDGELEPFSLPAEFQLRRWSTLGIIGTDGQELLRYPEDGAPPIALLPPDGPTPFRVFVPPDESRIVVELRGIANEIPIDGGTAAPYGPFADDTCVELSCAAFGFAPDGTSAFRIDTTLALAPTVGTPLSPLLDLGGEFSALWSPLGRRLLVFSSTAPRNTRTVTPTGEVHDLGDFIGRTWSDDETEIAGVPPTGPDAERGDVVDIVSVDGTERRGVLAPRQGATAFAFRRVTPR